MTALTDWLSSFIGEPGYDTTTLNNLITEAATTPAGIADPVVMLADWTAFRAAVLDWLGRNDTPTTDKVVEHFGDFILQAEAMMAHGSVPGGGLRGWINHYEAVSSIDVRVGALPNDFLAVEGADHILDPSDPDSSKRRHLQYMTTSQITEVYGNSPASAYPLAYSIIGKEIVLAPTPSEAVTIAIRYFGRVPPLNDTQNTVTDVLEDEPDLYLWGVLAQVADFLYDPERSIYYRGLFQAKIDALNDTFRKGRHGAIVTSNRNPVRGFRRRRL